MPAGRVDAGPAGRCDALAAAVGVLGELAQLDVPLGPRTTYRVGGPAAVLVEARRPADLERVAAARRASGLPLLVLGRGSNLLVADAGFPGIAVSVVEMAQGIDIDTASATVTAGGGVLLPVLARRTAAAGLTGFEWAVGVPGSVGGAVRMNAGGHGSDMSAALVEARVADLDGASADVACIDGAGIDGASGMVVRTIPAAELDLRFRGSALTADMVVLDARLQLAAGDAASAKRMIEEIVAWRRDHQPGGQNAGSVFVNPVPGEVSAGELIDGLGLRGRRRGTARVSEKHANFIQADEGGSADDVVALMREVRAEVAATTGFRLRSEIRLIGFEEGAR